MPILICACNSITYWDKIDTIVNIAGVSATVVAVIIALCANHKATEQLQKTIEMQEQSKNVELFDRREKLVRDIQSGEGVPEISLKLLFNEEIVLMYKKWRELAMEERVAEGELSYANSLRADNCNELDTKYKEIHAKAEDAKKHLVQLMEKYISNSIRPLTGE